MERSRDYDEVDHIQPPHTDDDDVDVDDDIQVDNLELLVRSGS